MWPESHLERRVSIKTQALAYALKLVLNHRTDWGTERRFRCPGFAETSSGLSDSSEARYLIQDIVDREARAGRRTTGRSSASYRAGRLRTEARP